jgi:hypothetical protein
MKEKKLANASFFIFSAHVFTAPLANSVYVAILSISEKRYDIGWY